MKMSGSREHLTARKRQHLLNQVLLMVIEPLVEQLPAIIMAALDAPIVAGGPDEFYADLPIFCGDVPARVMTAWRASAFPLFPT